MTTQSRKPSAAAGPTAARRASARGARRDRFEALVGELLHDLEGNAGVAFEEGLRSACARAASHFRATRLEIAPQRAPADNPSPGGGRASVLEIPLATRSCGATPGFALVAERPGEPWTESELGRLRLIGALFAAHLRQRTIELELHESEVWLYVAMESATFGTWDWDITSDRVRFIAPFSRLEGMPQIRETIGSDWFKVTHPDDVPAARALVENAIAGRSDDFAFTVRSQRPPYRAGEWIQLYSRGRVVERDAAGRAIRIMGVHEDVTEAKRKEEVERAREEHFARASRLLAISALTSSIAHEINQPLAAMTAFLQAARRLLDQGEGKRGEVVAALDRGVELAERASEIIRRLRRLLRREQPLREEFALAPLLESVRDQLLREARAAHVELRIAPGIPPGTLAGDRIQIEQALINLARNAVEALAGHDRGPKVVTLDAELADGWARLRVADTGAGIPEGERSRLFQPFHTTKREGSGLGLVICESIAELHGGRARLERSGPEGSVFVLELPQVAEGSDADAV